jgi:porin
MGFASTKVNQLGSYFGGGLVYSGLIPGRNEDQIGLAVAAAINGGKFKQAQEDAGRPVEGAEVTFELSYTSQILPHLAVHPDVQYVINPGMDPSLKNALVFGARFELSF